MKKILSILAAGIIFCSLTGCALVKNPNPQQTSDTMGIVPDTSSFIGEDKAKDMALQAAGITAEGTVFDRVELDRENGVWVYEVELRQGTTEYDVIVKADDGTIIQNEKDID